MDFYLPDLRRSIEDPLTDNNTTKTNIFAAKFFPKTGIVDFSDIEIKATMEQKAFNIGFIILTKEINKLIKSVLNRKALKPNSILNKVFKIVALVITKDLAKAFNYCFANKTTLKSLKESITVISHKKGKKTTFS